MVEKTYQEVAYLIEESKEPNHSGLTEDIERLSLNDDNADQGS